MNDKTKKERWCIYLVELRNVSVSYDNGVEALTHFSFKINDGELCFVTGKSGSGKSTFSKLITGELKAAEGSVCVNGYDMGNLKSKALADARRSMGMVFQDFRLIPSMTIDENLEFAMRCINAPVSSIKPRIEEVLELVSMKGMGGRLPTELSGGEQQRAAIARAIVNKPSLIIADEPTGNLDPTLAIDIMKLFLRINEMGTTALIITHAKELVDMFPQRVITIKKGKLVDDSFGKYKGSMQMPPQAPQKKGRHR